MFKIAALRSIAEDSGALFETGFFTPVANRLLNQALDIEIAKMRPHLVNLSESIVINEFPTNLGNYYGDIYELQLEQAKNSRMQQIDIGGVPPQWENYIKPFLHSKL